MATAYSLTIDGYRFVFAQNEGQHTSFGNCRIVAKLEEPDWMTLGKLKEDESHLRNGERLCSTRCFSGNRWLSRSGERGGTFAGGLKDVDEIIQ
jgi:hypothetical protein